MVLRHKLLASEPLFPLCDHLSFLQWPNVSEVPRSPGTFIHKKVSMMPGIVDWDLSSTQWSMMSNFGLPMLFPQWKPYLH